MRCDAKAGWRHHPIRFERLVRLSKCRQPAGAHLEHAMLLHNRRSAGRLLAAATLTRLAAPAAASETKDLPAMQAILRTDNAMTTLINVFHVEPAQSDALVALLQEGTRQWICQVPGFVSSTLHVSRDRSRVVIYGQWRNAESIDAMRQSPHMPPYFARVKALAQMEAMTCDVASVVAA